MGGASMFFALASLGLPGIGNFVGEFLVVLGAFYVSPALAAFASAGFVLSTAYSLRLVHRVFFGGGEAPAARDLTGRETAVMVLMIVPLMWLGLAPQPFLDLVKGGGNRPVHSAGQKQAAQPHGTASQAGRQAP